MGDFRKKKTLAKKYLGKRSCIEKNIYLMVYNADKNMLHNYMPGEKSYLHRSVGKKKSYPNQIKPPSTHQVKWSNGAQIPAADRGKGARNFRARAEEIKAGTNSV